MTTAADVPLRTFEGFLKQHAHDELSPLERDLFEVLFPEFCGHQPAQPAVSPLAAALSPLIKTLPSDGRTRRFAGYNFPRRRYFTLCADADGMDHQTLSHELRAYRDPVGVGMVEVIDLASGCRMSIGGAEVRLTPARAVAVLIHHPDRLPDRLRELKYQRLPGVTTPEIFLYRFPYTIEHRRFEQTIDLRHPQVRDWFFGTFREPSALSDSHLLSAGAGISPTTARSRFHFEDGIAPQPDSFWAMLPTLMNPDLGGGSPADTGSTLMMIGHWMRQRGVQALVYPSARADAAVVFEDGVMKHSHGWNLVDFGGSIPIEGAEVTTLVVSPWAWTALPQGVQLHTAAPHSRLSGSFAVENMVDYWGRDYVGQIQALDAARAIHGREPATAGLAPDGFRMFKLGALCLGWLRLALEQRPPAAVDGAIAELQGLAIPHRLYSVTGRIGELWADVARTRTLAAAMPGALRVCDLLCHALKAEYRGAELDLLARLGADIEWLLCWLVLAARANRGAGSAVDIGMLGREFAKTVNIGRLDAGLRHRSSAFLHRGLEQLRATTSDLHPTIDEGIQLLDAVYSHLKTIGNISTAS